MGTSVAPHQIRATIAARSPVAADLTTVLSVVAAILAAASGVIHLALVRHHRDYEVVTAGFTLVGGTQLLVAAGLLTRSSARGHVVGWLLHAGIVSTWLLSRTVGLIVVPGAEHRASFGLADTIANVFAVGVIASIATTRRLDRGFVRATLATRVARGIIAVVALGALALTATAAFAPHDHAGHDHPATEDPAPGHDDAPVGGHDDHVHDHG